MFTYFVFKNCVLIIVNYLNDIEYKNYFITPYFWYLFNLKIILIIYRHIDSKREKEGKVFLRPLRKEEIKFNHIISPYGYYLNLKINNFLDYLDLMKLEKWQKHLVDGLFYFL
jgi:hypothetical protein